jgi:hypothetical protein
MSGRSTWQHFTKVSMFVTHHLDHNFFNKYRFIIIWILILKWWQISYNFLSPFKWTMSKRFFDSNSGTNPWPWRKFKSSQRLARQMPSLRNGSIKQPFGTKYLCLNLFQLNIFLNLNVFLCPFQWTLMFNNVFFILTLHLEVEARIFFDNTMTNLGVPILESITI